MRNAARMIGMIWMALVAIGGVILFIRVAADAGTTDQLRRAYGLIALAFFVLLPGALLYRWGRGTYVPPPYGARLRASVYPPKTAREMGHVMREQDAGPRRGG